MAEARAWLSQGQGRSESGPGPGLVLFAPHILLFAPPWPIFHILHIFHFFLYFLTLFIFSKYLKSQKIFS